MRSNFIIAIMLMTNILKSSEVLADYKISTKNFKIRLETSDGVPLKNFPIRFELTHKKNVWKIEYWENLGINVPVYGPKIFVYKSEKKITDDKGAAFFDEKVYVNKSSSVSDPMISYDIYLKFKCSTGNVKEFNLNLSLWHKNNSDNDIDRRGCVLSAANTKYDKKAIETFYQNLAPEIVCATDETYSRLQDQIKHYTDNNCQIVEE
jgi:hypothetical protein